jgi:alpha-L-fucosidase
MKKQKFWIFCLLGGMLMLLISLACSNSDQSAEISKADAAERLAWWREARLGMFIHWGLYAIPAGEWNGETNHAEWIRTTAQIPLETYDQFVGQFNPVQFNAKEWVQLAKDAGMKYIVITSKHHDGFCLFDSKFTDFDVMSTPFQRDILKELSDACHQAGLQMCWYHSIMDWHHPDYLPRREWETNRPADGANLDTYIAYMKNQLKELVSNYGKIGVLWFDGEWEATWKHEHGRDLYHYVRGLQPDIVINNRVDKGRSGMVGLTKEGGFTGDFGTPEQEIPPTGLPDVDWETCMTMNDHWGFNKNDHNWKSSEDLLQKLADIASKGGNFLLNVGPTAEGLFPQPSIDRLKEMGRWMKINGESIYGTQASPFKNLPWGRCTQKSLEKNTRLYLHVFDWPKNGELVVPGIFNEPLQAYLLADAAKAVLPVNRKIDALVISVPVAEPDSINSVVVVDIHGRPEITEPPQIVAAFEEFVDQAEVKINPDRDSVTFHYTLDGSDPTSDSPVAQTSLRLTETTVVSARCFRNGKAVSPVAKKIFTKVTPRTAKPVKNLQPGLEFSYFEGAWEGLPNFKKLEPLKEGITPLFDLSPRERELNFGLQFSGFVQIAEDGMYAFYTDSNDGSQLFIDERLLVDNDGLHGLKEKEGVIALAAGLHPIRVTYFQDGGGSEFFVRWRSTGFDKQLIPESVLWH